MKTKIIKATLAIVCVVAMGAVSWKAYSTHNNGINDAKSLLLGDVEALSDIDISGWLSHITNPIKYYNQNTWIKEDLDCEITETENSCGVSGELTIGVKGIADVTIGAQSGSTTKTTTYPGHYISCTYDEEDGTEPHCDSTDCERK